MAETVASNLLGTLDNDLLVDAPGDTIIDALAGNDAIVGQFGDGDDMKIWQSGESRLTSVAKGCSVQTILEKRICLINNANSLHPYSRG